MSTYLIDFENVKSGGLTGMDHIKKEDSVHLFWSTRENKISIEMMEQIRNSESEIVMHKAVTGERDALDHQLCSYLGLLAGEKEETDFVIVSNDKAYDHLIEFWRRMNDAIHIQRVSEIAKVSMPEGESGKEEGLLSEELTASESKNSRRRERGGRYLKGNRKGTRRTASESASAAVTEEQAFGKMLEAAQVKEDQGKEAVSEEGTEPLQPVLEEPVVLPPNNEKEPETKSLEKPAETAAEEGTPYVEKQVEEVEVPAQPEKKQPRKPSAYVVTGIRTGIVVESGFTADGILEGTRYEEKHTPIEEKKAEAEAETPVLETAVKEESAEKVEKDASEGRPEDPLAKKQKPVKETAGEAASKEETAGEEALKEETSKKVKKETLSKEPQAEAVAEAEETEKLPEHAEGTEQEEKAKKAEKPVRKRRTSRPAKTGEGAKSLETEKEVAPARTARKRGRPKKEERPERLPEVRIPIVISDVVAKCPEADGAEWTAEVVNLINHSKDKKELYASIVRLLGQEKGRTVYHAIKILK